MANDKMKAWQDKLDELENFKNMGQIDYGQYQKQKRKIMSEKPLSSTAKKAWAVIGACIVIVMLIGSASTPIEENSKTENIAQQAKDELYQKEAERQNAIDQYAPLYCEKRQQTIVTNMKNEWPLNDGSGWTTEECVAIISNLYDAGIGRGDNELELVVNGSYAMGMSEVSIMYSLGTPSDINTTRVGDSYVKKQLVYGNPIYNALYIYTENGKVVTVQN